MTTDTAAIPFVKMSGAGNDFIVIDNRDGRVGDEAPDLARRVCRRRLSVGADGLILVEDHPSADFAWRFYNADGSRPGMCGNGARCVARFARLSGIAGDEMTFATLAGTIRARVRGDRVEIDMTPPGPVAGGEPIELHGTTVAPVTVDTGVPHAVVFVEDVEAVDVVGLGRPLRHHPRFAPAGTNANFVAVQRPGRLALRTYERGVEDETLACGTGAVAAALVAARRHGWPSPVDIETRSGAVLTVHFTPDGDGVRDVRLEGDARLVCRGEMGPDAWRY